MIGNYLMFNGNCSKAIESYQQAFKAEVVEMMTYGDMSPNPAFPVSEAQKSQVLNCRIKIGENEMMCADSPDRHQVGQNMYVTYTNSDAKAVQYAWDILKKEAHIYMELAPTFFAELHGSLQDKYGINWMFTARAQEKKKVKPSYRFKKEVSPVIFNLNYNGAQATAQFRKNKEFIIFKGAKLTEDIPLNKDGTVGFAAKTALALRSEHEDHIKKFVTTADIKLKSPHEAGMFMYFGGTNAWLEFKDEKGKPIHDYCVTNM